MITSQIPVQQPIWGPHVSGGGKKHLSSAIPVLGMNAHSVPENVAVGKANRHNWASSVSLTSSVSRPPCLCSPLAHCHSVLQSQEVVCVCLALRPPGNDGSHLPVSADMAVQNFVGDACRGATWVALHNGGGVGW